MSTFGIAFPSRNSKKSELLEMDLVIGPAVFVIVSTEFCALILWGPIGQIKNKQDLYQALTDREMFDMVWNKDIIMYYHKRHLILRLGLNSYRRTLEIKL